MSDTPMWKTLGGVRRPISELEDSHLLNIHRWCKFSKNPHIEAEIDKRGLDRSLVANGYLPYDLPTDAPAEDIVLRTSIIYGVFE